MQLSIRLVTRPVTRPRPGSWIRVVILVIIIVAVVVTSGIGYGPATAVALITAAGLAGARVARALLAGDTPAA